MKNIFVTALSASIVVVLTTGCGGGQSSTAPTVSKHDIPAISSRDKRAYLNAINSARTEGRDCGSKSYNATNKLSWNNSLYEAAYEHSHDMAESNTFEHKGSGTETDWTAHDLKLNRGSTYIERIEHNGFPNRHHPGENIAAGEDSVNEAIDDWLKSSEHCENIMSPKFTEMGMSMVKKNDSEYGFYWTIDFGSK